MADQDPEQLRSVITQVQDYLAAAFESLATEDLFAAGLQLHRIRTLINSISASLPEAAAEGSADLSHDWRVADPYTAECRICGAQRPLSTVFHCLDPLLPLGAV